MQRKREKNNRTGKIRDIFKREMGGSDMKVETYVYLWLIHSDVLQKNIKLCKAIMLQLRIDELKKSEILKEYFIQRWHNERQKQ